MTMAWIFLVRQKHYWIISICRLYPSDETSGLAVWVLHFRSGFPLYFGTEIQVLFNDFQGPWSCIFKEQFFTKVYSMDSITAIFNTYFCDYRTVLVDKNKTWQLLATLVLGKTCLTQLLIIAQFDLMNSRIFKDLCNEIQGFSSTCPVFKYVRGLEFRRKNSSTFKGTPLDMQGLCSIMQTCVNPICK